MSRVVGQVERVDHVVSWVVGRVERVDHVVSWAVEDPGRAEHVVRCAVEDLDGVDHVVSWAVGRVEGVDHVVSWAVGRVEGVDHVVRRPFCSHLERPPETCAGRLVCRPAMSHALPATPLDADAPDPPVRRLAAALGPPGEQHPLPSCEATTRWALASVSCEVRQ